jgi:hypothetical protein
VFPCKKGGSLFVNLGLSSLTVACTNMAGMLFFQHVQGQEMYQSFQFCSWVLIIVRHDIYLHVLVTHERV